MPFGSVPVELHELEPSNAEALALEAGDDLPRQPALEGVRLDEDQRSLCRRHSVVSAAEAAVVAKLTQEELLGAGRGGRLAAPGVVAAALEAASSSRLVRGRPSV